MFKNIFLFTTLFLTSFSVYAQKLLISEGDVVKITVYNNPDLTTSTKVFDNGLISFPLIGEFKISGLSPYDAERKLGEELVNQGFLKQAQINIVVDQSTVNQISVLGYVNRPGKYPMDYGTQNMIDYIIMAGGINSKGADKAYLLKKKGSTYTRHVLDVNKVLVSGDLSVINSTEFEVSKGDIIFVPQMPVFYVLGQVNRPGSFRLEEGMSVAQALSVGGGLRERGSESGLVIKRKNKNGQLTELKVSESTMVQENDVIYVKESLF